MVNPSFLTRDEVVVEDDGADDGLDMTDPFKDKWFMDNGPFGMDAEDGVGDLDGDGKCRLLAPLILCTDGLRLLFGTGTVDDEEHVGVGDKEDAEVDDEDGDVDEEEEELWFGLLLDTVDLVGDN